MLAVVAGAGFAVERHASRGVIEATMRIESPGDSLARVRPPRSRRRQPLHSRRSSSPRSVAVYGASPRRGTIGGELFRNRARRGISRRRAPGQPQWRGRRGHPGAHDAERGRRGSRPRGHLRARRVRPRRGERCARGRRAGAVRRLGRLRRGRAPRAPSGRTRCSLSSARTAARLIGPNCLGIASTAAPAQRDVRSAAACRPAPWASHRRAERSASPSSSRRASAGSASRRSCRSATRRTCPPTTCSSTGRTTTRPRSSRSISRASATRSASGGSRGAWRGTSRCSRSRAASTAAGARAAASHTAALASSDVAVDALFRQAGVLRAKTLSEFLDAAVLLSIATAAARSARRRRHECRRTRDPLLPTRARPRAWSCRSPPTVTRDALRAVLPAEAQPRESDRPARLGDGRDVRRGAAAAARRSGLRRRLRPLRPAGRRHGGGRRARGRPRRRRGRGAQARGRRAAVERDAGAERESPRHIATFASPEAAARALGVAARRAAWLRRPEGVVPRLPDVDRAAARAVVASALVDADEASGSMRRRAGVCSRPTASRSLPRSSPTTPDDAARAAAELGVPVVVKSAVPGAHKTETGGVALDLRDPDAARAAAARIGGTVLVQPMLAGSELIAGVVHDPVFGPLVALGLGGIFAELVGAVSLGIAPLTDIDADDLVTAGAVGRLVAGFRGSATARRRRAHADLLHRLSALALDVPEIRGARSQSRARHSVRMRCRRPSHPGLPRSLRAPRQDLVRRAG